LQPPVLTSRSDPLCIFSIQPTLSSAISYGIFLGSDFLLGTVVSGYLLALACLTGA